MRLPLPWGARDRGDGARRAGGSSRIEDADDAEPMMVVMPSKNPPVSPLFGAATLNASLSPVKRDLTSIEVKQPSSSQSVSGTIHGLLKPRGPGYCDHSTADRAANLVTCLPYCLLAARNVARAKTAERKIYAGALTAVATFSTAYHALDGSHKEAWARKADYWAIACAATAMGRMLFPKGDVPGFYSEEGGEGEGGGEEESEVGGGSLGFSSSTSPSSSSSASSASLFPPRRGRTRVSLSLTPFQPFAVITAHSVAMEAEFARRARKERKEGRASSSLSASHHHHHHHHHHSHSHSHSHRSLSAAHRLHVCSGVAAVVAFFAEDLWPRLPFVHSTWHVLSAVAMAATEPLVDDAEGRLLRGRARARGAREAERRKRGGSGGGRGV